MKPEDSEEVAPEMAGLALAEELGRRLKRDMRTEVEAVLAGFLEEMKAFPQPILQEAGANRESMLNALDQQLEDKEGNGTSFEQEFERLRKKAETAHQARIVAERDTGRVEALHRSLQEEKARVEQNSSEAQARFSHQADALEARIETQRDALASAEGLAETRLKEKTDAERVSHASERNNETLNGQLRSSKNVSRIIGGVFLIFILAAVSYLVSSQPGKEMGAGSIDRSIEKPATDIEPDAGTGRTAPLTQIPIAAGPIEKNENASIPAPDKDRPAVEPTPKPEPLKPEPSLPTTLAEIYYASGSIDISQDMSDRIRLMAETFRNKSGILIHIEGYSDDKGLRSTIVDRYIDNIGLSQARAGSIARLFIKSGITPERVRIIGMGAGKPFVPNNSPENRAKNRRAVIKTIDRVE